MHSIILTVHNKDWLIERVIEGIYKYTAEPYELIVVIDGCTDNSEKIIWDSLSGTPVKRKFVYAPNVFETKANNLGMKIAEGDKIIIVQDDMIIKEQAIQCRTALQSPAPVDADNLLQQLVQHCQRWDAVYKLNASELYPELKDIFDQYGYQHAPT